MPNGPLNKSYPADAALVICSLVPYLVLTAAVLPLSQIIARSVGLSTTALDVTISVSTAGYAVGTVLAVQFAVRLPARRMLVLYEVMLTVSAVLAAWAPTGGVFIGAFIAEGLATSLLLIAAVPPLVTRWPARKMPLTGGIMNLCIFGAVAVGPTIGAIQASSGDWRPLFWGVACVAALALVLSLLTFEDVPPADLSSPWDFVAIALAVVGSGAAFFGAGWLEATKVAGLVSLVPLVGGLALIVILVVYQYTIGNPLMPVRATATTAPVTGIFLALMASAASFGIMELVLQALRTASSPLDTGLLFLPEFAAAIAVAALFGAVFKTRFMPLLALAGLPAIAISAALLLTAVTGAGPLVAAGVGILGLGVAASVSPGLFMAGFSLRSAELQRVFALIELLRAMTAFLVAPILVYLASVLGTSQSAGIRYSLWICLGIAVLGFAGGLALYLGGYRRLQTPDLERWQAEGEPAWESPPLLSRLRGQGRHELAERPHSHAR